MIKVEPKIFITDVLELIFYFKNINSLTVESTNFSLNDDEFLKIKKLSNNLDSKILLLFWQFTIKTIEELDIVSNQNLSIEMFLIRLMYLTSYEPMEKKKEDDLKKKFKTKIEEKNLNSDLKNETVNQIKNTIQEKKLKLETQKEIDREKSFYINSFDHLLKICHEKKEIKLKYELENNVNLVRFEKNIIEISFNDNLDKNFVKDLSSKLFEWTSERWIISFSKLSGDKSIKEKRKIKKLSY